MCSVVIIIGDMIYEATSSFTVTVRAVNDADTIQGPDVALVIISDNDDITGEI